ncbi:MAG: YggS family pyridoxal phosphate-dependent enzyme [Gammaproteobacteria bacterium]
MNGDPIRDEALQANYARVLARIDEACRRSGRPAGSVRLVAVSKTFGAERVLALAGLGQRAFGENYVQEALGKMALCRERRPDLSWHFIGPIQSNKTRQIAEQFDWVHSVEREKVAVRLGEQRPARLGPLDCCIQVNVSGEASKSGCAPEAALALARAIVAHPRLRLRGLMAIPEPGMGEAVLRGRFATLRRMLEEIREALSSDWPTAARALDALSMGMSADLEVAIDEGATLVRVGSALFGSRPAAVARDR